MSQKIFLKLHCDQTVGFFQDFSTVLKSFCPAESKNTFVFILADVFVAISIPCEWIHSLRENSKEPILHTFLVRRLSNLISVFLSKDSKLLKL